MKNNLLLLLVGFFAGLWFSERRKNQELRETMPTPSARKNRTLEELSPTLATNSHPLKSIHAINPDDLHAYVDGVTKELIRPDLTPLEAKLVADYLRTNVLTATSYGQLPHT